MTSTVKIGYLVVGLIFLGLATSWLLDETDVIDPGSYEWLLPAILLGAGLIGLFASLGRRRAPQLLVDSWPAHAQGGLRVSAHQYRHRRRASEVRRRRLRWPVQPADRSRRRRRDVQPRRLHVRRAQYLRARQSVCLRAAPAHALRLHPGRLARLAEPDVQSRAPIRAGDAAVGTQQLPDQLRSRYQHVDSGQ